MVLLPVITALTILLAEATSEVRIENNINTSNVSVSSSSNSDVSVSTKSTGGTNSVIINNDKFEIEGTVDSVSGGAFTINSQKIEAAEDKISSLKNSGVLKNGNQVKVKGTITNSILYAENVELVSAPAPQNTAAPSGSQEEKKPVGEKVESDASNSAVMAIVVKILALLGNLF